MSTKKRATGALSGAATGAAIGSAVPGIGTALGAGIGGFLGLLGGGGPDPEDVRPEWLSAPRPTDPRYWSMVDGLMGFSMSPQWSQQTGGSTTSQNSTTSSDNFSRPEILPGYQGMEGVIKNRAMSRLLEPGGVPTGTEQRMVRSVNQGYRAAADAARERAGVAGFEGPNPALDQIDMARATALSDIPAALTQMGDAREAAAMDTGRGVLGQFGTGQRSTGTSRTRGSSSTTSSSYGTSKGQIDPGIAQLALWGAGGPSPNDQWYVPGAPADNGGGMMEQLVYLLGSGAFGNLGRGSGTGMNMPQNIPGLDFLGQPSEFNPFSDMSMPQNIPGLGFLGQR